MIVHSEGLDQTQLDGVSGGIAGFRRGIGGMAGFGMDVRTGPGAGPSPGPVMALAVSGTRFAL